MAFVDLLKKSIELQTRSTDALTSRSVDFYVDSVNGADGNAGTPHAPFLTIAKAVTQAVSLRGDRILIVGSFNEAVTCSKVGVSFIGLGTGPSEATWTAPTVAASFCLKLAANSCKVTNIRFKPVIYTTSGTPAGILLSGANYTTITKCRFQGLTGSHAAIYSPVCDSDNVEISDCQFMYMNTATYGAAILGVEAGGLSYSGWRILRNIFSSCVTAININGRLCVIEGNHILINGIAANASGGAVCTMGIDLSGTSSYGNAVHGNYLGGAYSATLYVVAASGDDWAGNYNIAGVTAANPA